MIQIQNYQQSSDSSDDLLKQMTSLALAESATQLSSLTSTDIRFRLDDFHKANAATIETLFKPIGDHPVVIEQAVEGSGRGTISWVMADQSALLLTRELISERSRFSEMTEMEQETYTEIANILLNACLSHYAKAFNLSFSSQLPRFDYQHFGHWLRRVMPSVNIDSALIGQITISTLNKDYTAILLWSGLLVDSQTRVTPLNTTVDV